MNSMELKSDLTLIEESVKRADVPEGTKRLLMDMLAWNTALVDGFAEHAASVDDALDELLGDADEGIAPETAKILLIAYEQSRILCDTVEAILASGALDEVTSTRLTGTVRSTKHSILTAIQTVQEIIQADDTTGGDDSTEEEEDSVDDDSEDVEAENADDLEDSDDDLDESEEA